MPLIASPEKLTELLAYLVAAYRGAQSADPRVAALNALEMLDTVDEAADMLGAAGALAGFTHRGAIAIHHDDGTLTAG